MSTGTEFDSAAYKRVLTKTFSALINFCQQNGIEYFLSAGTCIGAVRHHGFIPWDDDIDIFMKRAEYNRFLSLRDQLPEGYGLVLMGENGYSAPIPKFYDKNTTLWEEKSIECVIGAYIDIFPMDECTEDVAYCMQLKKRYEWAYLHYMDSTRKWKWEDFREKLVHLHPMGFIRLFKNTFYHRFRREYYLNQYQTILKEIQSMHGPNITGFDGAFASIYPKKWFDSTVDGSFEGLTVKLPVDYDAYLTQTYGDYMTPPPPEKRGSTHSHFYLNLEKGLTLDEVKAIVNY